MDDPYWKIFLTKRHCPLYALGIVMRAETTRKSGCLEIESSAAADGETVYRQVESKTAAKQLILSAAADQVAIDRLVHNAGSRS
ncbi:hypothetical protein [Echinicola rosea]|uniref:hypothetical protein n=1 Tax=Echinicola rosea TaxID=1807691 RepID=UPI0016514CA2|nr:hypothetical protein [Echinicola rosea]